MPVGHSIVSSLPGDWKPPPVHFGSALDVGGTGRSYHLIGHFSRAPKSPHRVIFVQPDTGSRVSPFDL